MRENIPQLIPTVNTNIFKYYRLIPMTRANSLSAPPHFGFTKTDTIFRPLFAKGNNLKTIQF